MCWCCEVKDVCLFVVPFSFYIFAQAETVMTPVLRHAPGPNLFLAMAFPAIWHVCGGGWIYWL